VGVFMAFEAISLCFLGSLGKATVMMTLHDDTADDVEGLQNNNIFD
jgi:hypothetical protein